MDISNEAIMNSTEIVNGDVERVLISPEDIDRATSRIASMIDSDYKDCDGKIVILGILKGSVMFMSDLMKKISLPVEIDFMKVSSYAGTNSTGRIKIILDLNRKDLSECNIIIIEDIIDSGRTLSYLVEYLKINGAKSIKTCTLLDKPERREVEFVPDYVGYEIPNEFVVGYGLDYEERYRTLPYVGVLSRRVYDTEEDDK